ncbi:MAG: PepSY domain-containing protein [Giesbergeria sp.]|jgi:hypothetical protein|nr:PepSY domain-containing protein [Giesbergeria sp.]
MKHSRFLRRGLLSLALGLVAVPIWADDDCDAPVERWQSRDAVRQMADRQGWQIQRLKIDDGCYEIRGTDSQGRSFKAKIDPETLKVLKLKQRDRKRDREHDRERDRDSAAQQNRLPQPDGAAAPSPLFTPGTAPRGQIE